MGFCGEDVVSIIQAQVCHDPDSIFKFKAMDLVLKLENGSLKACTFFHDSKYSRDVSLTINGDFGYLKMSVVLDDINMMRRVEEICGWVAKEKFEVALKDMSSWKFL